jgi:hypothetical protein
MTHIILTGAGFNRNWGGLLAGEMFNQLIGSTFFDDGPRTLLWRSRRSGEEGDNLSEKK